MSEDYLLGIDLGTTGCKSVIFDLEGNEISKEYVEYPLYVSSKENLSEQDPNDWWNAVKYTIKKSLLKNNISPVRIKGIGVTGQSTSVVFLDKNKTPLRPAILYSDARGEKYIQKMSEKVGPMNYVETKIFTNLQWVREHEPDIFTRIANVVDAKEYIGYKLTGVLSLDGFVLDKDRFKDLAETFDISLDLFGDFHTYSSPIGTITDDASRDTGLLSGTPVIIGPWDGMCNIIGSGLINDGDTMDVAGTTEIVAAVHSEKVPAITHKHILPGKWIAYTSTSLAVGFTWLRNILSSFQKLEESIDLYSVLNQEAKKVQLGSNGLIYVPTIQGEFMRPHLRAGFIGLSLEHKVGHLTRAIFEGVAFYLRQMIEGFEENGIQVGNIRVSGGGAKSELWNQIKADVLGKKLIVLKSKETAALGSVILASVALGLFKNYEQAMSSMIHVERTFDPILENKKHYDVLYNKFKKAIQFFDEFLMK
ncbi:MAG: xylulokinase [Candidatus Asgardarchaeia archaeon]